MSYNEINFARQLEVQDEVLSFLKSEAGQSYLKKNHTDLSKSAVEIVIELYNNWPVSQ